MAWSPMPPERVRAFAPGRVCLIGEHTDYNDGLALAMAIAQGVTVDAQRIEPGRDGDGDGVERVLAQALDLDEHDEFALADPQPAQGWRAFVRGTVAELQRAELHPVGASLRIEGDVPRGSGLSSSAALEVALALALLALAGTSDRIGKTELAELCSRVENEWAGAQTGLLDQLSSLYGARDTALRIDFRTLDIDAVPLYLDGWRLVTLDTGERRSNANQATTSAGPNARVRVSCWACDRCARLTSAGSRSCPSPCAGGRGTCSATTPAWTARSRRCAREISQLWVSC